MLCKACTDQNITNIIQFHLWEVVSVVKFIETGSRMVVAWGGPNKCWVSVMSTVSVWEDEWW